MHGGQRHLSVWTVSKHKRIFDVAAVLFIAPVAIIAILVAATTSALVFRAQPFFVQYRRGVHGEMFRVIKIRSLPTDFGSMLGKHQLDGVQMHWFSTLLRSSHIDELPQLWNVLRGQMSVVGPRPMIDEVLERLPRESVTSRLQARPGMTGIWQVSTMGEESLDLCPQLDEWYVAHGSVKVDVRVLLWTVSTALRGTRQEPRQLLERLDPTGACPCVTWSDKLPARDLSLVPARIEPAELRPAAAIDISRAS